MKQEIEVAASWWTDKLSPLPPETSILFHQHLVSILNKRFENHWFSSESLRGSGYRSMLYSPCQGLVDPVLIEAAKLSSSFSCQLSLDFLKKRLLKNLGEDGAIMWIDPFEVSYATFNSPKQQSGVKAILYRKNRKSASPSSTSPSSSDPSSPLSQSPPSSMSPLSSLHSVPSSSRLEELIKQNKLNKSSSSSSGSSSNVSFNNGNSSSSSQTSTFQPQPQTQTQPLYQPLYQPQPLSQPQQVMYQNHQSSLILQQHQVMYNQLSSTSQFQSQQPMMTTVPNRAILSPNPYLNSSPKPPSPHYSDLYTYPQQQQQPLYSASSAPMLYQYPSLQNGEFFPNQQSQHISHHQPQQQFGRFGSAAWIVSQSS